LFDLNLKSWIKRSGLFFLLSVELFSFSGTFVPLVPEDDKCSLGRPNDGNKPSILEFAMRVAIQVARMSCVARVVESSPLFPVAEFKL